MAEIVAHSELVAVGRELETKHGRVDRFEKFVMHFSCILDCRLKSVLEYNFLFLIQNFLSSNQTHTHTHKI